MHAHVVCKHFLSKIVFAKSCCDLQPIDELNQDLFEFKLKFYADNFSVLTKTTTATTATAATAATTVTTTSTE